MVESDISRKKSLFAKQRKPIIIAHRGDSIYYPENTLIALETALYKGADALEMDVRVTSDRNVVLMHDRTVERTTDGKGKVEEMTLEEVKSLDAGYNFKFYNNYPFRGKGLEVPTLEEVLNTFPDQLLVLEIKENDLATVEEVAKLITQYEAENRVLVISFHDSALNMFRKLTPNVPTCGGVRESLIFYMLSHMGAARWVDWFFDCLVYIPGYAILTESLKKEAYLTGLHIYASTTNSQKEMWTMIEEGVEGILTDYPALLKKVIQKYYAFSV